MEVRTIVKNYLVPTSFIIEDFRGLEVHFKYRGDDKVVKKFDEIIKDFIDIKKQQADVNGLYNLLFELDVIFTFKAKYKDLLAGNNIHIQII